MVQPRVREMIRAIAQWVWVVVLVAACGSDTHNARFVVQNQGSEILDTVTGLAWQTCPQGMGSVWPASPERVCQGTANTYTWGNAQARAQAVAVQSGKPWRLPTVQELSSLRMDTAHPTSWAKQPFLAELALVHSDRINPDVSPNFWSSNVYDGDISKNAIWFVSLGSGSVSNRSPNQEMYVRLVR